VGACSGSTSSRSASLSDGLSGGDVSQAIGAVSTNWTRCLATIGVSTDGATVETIADSKTGRPIDVGNHPVLVRVKWGAKSATFLVDLEGHLHGAALYGPVAVAMRDAARKAGGHC
jgi:hypothetical protein